MRRLFEELEHRISTDPCWAHIDHLAVDGPETHVRSFHGEDIHRPLDTYSLTKPIVTTLIGAVVDDGYLEGIDERAAEILPAAGERHPALTVRHLLTMTASIAADGFMDIDRVMKRESSWVDDILSLPAERAPGKRVQIRQPMRTPHSRGVAAHPAATGGRVRDRGCFIHSTSQGGRGPRIPRASRTASAISGSVLSISRGSGGCGWRGDRLRPKHWWRTGSWAWPGSPRAMVAHRSTVPTASCGGATVMLTPQRGSRRATPVSSSPSHPPWTPSW